MKRNFNIYNNCGRCLLGVRFNVGWFNVGVPKEFKVGRFNVAGPGLYTLGTIRFFHNKKFHKTINQLYKDKGRRATPVHFDENPIDGFSDLRDKLAIRTFFKKFIRKGGIYKFSLINKPHIFYIGSTLNFRQRFCKHTSTNALTYHYDLFHVFAKDCGWDKFKFEILEQIDDLSTLRDRENFYLSKYKPILNSLYKSGIVIHRDPNRTSKDWLKVTGYSDGFSFHS